MNLKELHELSEEQTETLYNENEIWLDCPVTNAQLPIAFVECEAENEYSIWIYDLRGNDVLWGVLDGDTKLRLVQS
jgi:hypothetical protein